MIRSGLVGLGAALVLLLAACASVPGAGGATGESTGGQEMESGGAVAPRDEPQRTPETPIAPTRTTRSLSAGGHVECASGESISLEGSALQWDVAGGCGSIQVRGDDQAVQAAEAGAVWVEGQSNAVEVAGTIGTLSITGDSNRVEAASIDDIAIRGATNAVHTGRIGSLTVAGHSNAIAAANEPSPKHMGDDSNTFELAP